VSLPRSGGGARPGPRQPARCNRTVANQPGNEGKPPPSAYALVNIGLEMAVPLVVLVFAGYKADGWLDTDPWLKVVGAILGLTVGLYTFYKRLLMAGGKSGR